MSYERIKEIGRGGFGIVYLVQDDEGNQFALKTLNEEVLEENPSADVVARFRREVKYQSEIEHPNVVRVVDADLSAELPWFVMELADCSLADELNVDRTLGGEPKKAIFDILAGLHAIHEKGFKHRDLKPENILSFAADDGTNRYAISDFGLMTPEAGQTTTLTATNMQGGTLMYRAPECALSFRRATNHADIYSFGAILHDIFVGLSARLPHAELNAPGAIGPVLEKCTKRQPRRRYQSIEELREAVFDALDQENLTFSSQEEEEIVSLLRDNDQLSDEQWDRVFDLIDENEDRGEANKNIFRQISIGHIQQLQQSAPELFHSLGLDYAAYAGGGTFDFDYCDVIASKGAVFYDHGDSELKSLIAVSMLLLGTSHNRWLVERTFLRMAGPNIEDQLAERIAVELDVQSIYFDHQFSHLELSISAKRDDLHPVLRALLSDDADET